MYTYDMYTYVHMYIHIYTYRSKVSTKKACKILNMKHFKKKR